MNLKSAIRRWLAAEEKTVLADPGRWLTDWMGGGATAVGIPVTEDSAMRLSAVYASIRIIAGTIASLPIEVKEFSPATGKPGQAVEHPVAALLRAPNRLAPAPNMVMGLVEGLLRTGNGLATLTLRGGGAVRAIEPLTAHDTVRIGQVRRQGDWIPSYRIARERQTLDGVVREEGVFPTERVIHAAGPGFDGVRSPSPITRYARDVLGLGLAYQEFQGRAVSNGGKPSGTLSIPEGVTEDRIDHLMREWNRAHGSLRDTGKTAFLFSGTEFRPLSFSPVDAEILATRRFVISEIASIFGVPLWLLGHMEKSTSWGSGLEEQSRAFMKHTIAPWLAILEAEFTRKLIPVSEQGRLRVRFDRESMARGTLKDMSGFLESMVSKAAIMTPNEARGEMGYPPVEGGDALRQPTGAPAQGGDENADARADDVRQAEG